MGDVKTCRQCFQTKPILAFGLHRGERDGRRRICKVCRKASTPRQYYIPRTGPRKDQEHLKARYALRQAVRRGKLEKPEYCEVCGERYLRAEIQAHHFAGYDDPLRVIWLCASCHQAEHHSDVSESGLRILAG